MVDMPGDASGPTRAMGVSTMPGPSGADRWWPHQRAAAAAADARARGRAEVPAITSTTGRCPPRRRVRQSRPGTTGASSHHPRVVRDAGGPRVRRSSLKVLVTGAAGFINGYLIPELLDAGHTVVGVDDFSKYGPRHPQLRRAPSVHLRRGGRQGRGAPDRARPGLRPGGRGGGDDRRHQLLPPVRVRPARGERAHPRVDVPRGHRRARARAPRAHRGHLVVHGVRVDHGLPDPGGRPAHQPAARLHLRLPEARVGVLRQGRLGAVPAAVHHRAAVQLRRHRRAPGAAAMRRSCPATSSWP